jgi:opacity protein-like surface antigen
MKNNYLITDLGPHLLVDHSLHRPARPWGSWVMGLALWAAVLGILCWMTLGEAHAQSTQSDPMVMKVYPDGTKMVLRWSEVGKQVDNGEKYGGAPRIVAYDPAKDGIVPIGEPATAATNAALPPSSSVISPQQPARMDYTNADPKDYDENLGPQEGFVFRTAAGVAYQQPLSGRDSNGLFGNGPAGYNKLVFQPGIRFDLEPSYNVTDWFRVGLETAFIYNQLHSATINGTGLYSGGSTIGNGGLYQIPVLANVSFHFPSDGPIRGYLGGGTGATWNVLQISAGGGSPYTSYQWNYAWQVTAGFTYCVAPGLDLDIAYKMLSNPSPNFNNMNSFKSSYNHAAEIGLAWRF